MDNDTGVSFIDVIVILIVVMAFLMMIQLTLMALRNEAQLSEAVVAITEYVDNECTGE